MHWAKLLGILCAVCFVATCSTGQPGKVDQPSLTPPEPAVQQPPQPAAQSGIPLPGSLAKFLPKPRSTSYVEADLIKPGDSYTAALPNHNVQKSAPSVDFDPSWNGPPDTTSELAYCMYAFDIPGYDRNAQVRYTWGTPPTDIGDAWIGLANWDDDGWDWYACQPTGLVNLPDIEPYFAFGGGLLVCVTLMGTDNSSLAEIRIGSQLPQPDFTPTARYGFSPLVVNFDAGASTDPDGTVSQYEWDLDGNGTFETDAGSTPTLEYEFTGTGIIDVGLQVTDNDGVSDSTTGVVALAESFRHTWGLNDTDTAQACVVDAAGNVYIAGSTSSVNATSDLLIAKFNALGQFVWAKAFDGGGHEGLKAIIMGSDDLLYVCGNSLSFGNGSQGVIQKWTTGGDLVWSKHWGGGEHEFLHGLVMSSGDVFVVGQTASFGQGDVDAVIMRIAPDGSLVWDKTFGGIYYDIATAIVRKPSLIGSTSLRITGATEDTSALDVDVLYLSVSEDGDKFLAQGFGNDRIQIGRALTAGGLLGGVSMIAGYTETMSGDDNLYLAVGGAWQKTLDIDILDQANAIYPVGDGFLIGGQIINNGTSVRDAYLFTMSSAGVGIKLETLDAGNLTDDVTAMTYFSGGVVFAGRSGNAAGSWQEQSFTLTDVDGGWYTVPESTLEVNATYANASGTVSAITTGVMDVGGGSDDLFFELREL